MREVGLGKVRVDAQTQEEVHFSSVRQAEQRNKIQEKEEHGAKRGVRGLESSPHRTSPYPSPINRNRFTFYTAHARTSASDFSHAHALPT